MRKLDPAEIAIALCGMPCLCTCIAFPVRKMVDSTFCWVSWRRWAVCRSAGIVRRAVKCCPEAVQGNMLSVGSPVKSLSPAGRSPVPATVSELASWKSGRRQKNACGGRCAFLQCGPPAWRHTLPGQLDLEWTMASRSWQYGEHRPCGAYCNPS